MKDIAITGVGMATAQGDAARVRGDHAPEPAVPLPWPVRRSAAAHLYRPAQVAGTGMARMIALAEQALVECPRVDGEPLVLASCNGGATTFERDDWRRGFELGRALDTNSPVASAACASGMHALYLARTLIEAGAPSAMVLAVDIATQPSHDNFESLRIVADELAPYQPEAAGFTVGEAAVCVRLARVGRTDGVPITGPVLGQDLDDDALQRVLAALPSIEADLVLGQATGPAVADRAELAAIATRVRGEVALSSASHHFGHALGASSLLAVALAAIARDAIPRALAMPHAHAADRRPLVTGSVRAERVLVACRALGGACGTIVVGSAGEVTPAARQWRTPIAAPALRHELLRELARVALDHRPAEPPALLVVTFDAPLQPPGDAWIGTRLLPSSVLELTPGFVTQLVARSWGFAGPAVTLVGGDPAAILAASRRTHDRVYHLAIRGMDDHRDVGWN